MAKMRAADAEPVLGRWQRVVYGLPNFGYSIATLPMLAFLPAFYSSERGLSLASVGLMIAITRLSDVITDPFVGWVSDRIKTPIGRRRPVILAGLPLFCVAVWMLFVPPEKVSLIYVLVWTALTYFAFTLVDLPLRALGAELSPRYDERSELAGWREGCGIVGVLAGLAAAVAVAQNSSGEWGPQLEILALIAVVTTPLFFCVTLYLLPEPPLAYESVRVLSIGTKVSIILRNGPFLRLLLVSVALMGSLLGTGALTALICENVYDEKGAFPILMFGELVTMLAVVPLWVALSKRLSKHQALAIGSLSAAIFCLAIPLIATGSFTIFVVLVILKSIGLGSITVLLNGLAADVVDIDTARTGETRTGVYFAFWGMAMKGAAAVGVLVATSIPALLGFEITEEGARGADLLLWTYGLGPAVGLLSSAYLMNTWPLTKERQFRIRMLIDRRTARLSNRSQPLRSAHTDQGKC